MGRLRDASERSERGVTNPMRKLLRSPISCVGAQVQAFDADRRRGFDVGCDPQLRRGGDLSGVDRPDG
jgi:hypothetical protein